MFDFEEDSFNFDSEFDFVDNIDSLSMTTEVEATTDFSGSTDSADTPTSSSVTVKKTNKRKRSVRQSTVVIPRLLMNDIRRSYAFMFVNTLNNSDIALFYEFLGAYSCNNVTYLQEAPGCSDVKFFELNGINSICQLFYNKMQALPDSVHRIPDYCRVITRPDSTTEIVAIMNYEATRLFDVGFEFILPQPKESENHDLKIINKTTNKCAGTLDGSINDRLLHLPVLKKPIEMFCTMQFTMYLNENKQIERFSLTLPRNLTKSMK